MTKDPILDAFDRLVRNEGSAMLVATSDRAASRADVRAWASAAASALDDAGAAPGEYVLVVSVNGAGFLAALLAARISGLVPVLADWSSPEAELTRIEDTLGIATR